MMRRIELKKEGQPRPPFLPKSVIQTIAKIVRSKQAPDKVL
jgi:hypothetical protein